MAANVVLVYQSRKHSLIRGSVALQAVDTIFNGFTKAGTYVEVGMGHGFRIHSELFPSQDAIQASAT